MIENLVNQDAQTERPRLMPNRFAQGTESQVLPLLKKASDPNLAQAWIETHPLRAENEVLLRDLLRSLKSPVRFHQAFRAGDLGQALHSLPFELEDFLEEI